MHELVKQFLQFEPLDRMKLQRVSRTSGPEGGIISGEMIIDYGVAQKVEEGAKAAKDLSEDLTSMFNRIARPSRRLRGKTTPRVAAVSDATESDAVDLGVGDAVCPGCSDDDYGESRKIS